MLLLPLLHTLVTALRDRCRLVVTRGPRDALSSETLRDLAIDRSELCSIEAESRGLVPPTRRRITQEPTKSYACGGVRDEGSNAASNARCLSSNSYQL